MIKARLNGINVDIPNSWDELSPKQLKKVEYAFAKFTKVDDIRKYLLLIIFNVKSSWRLQFLFFYKSTTEGLEGLYHYTKFLDNPLKKDFIDHLNFEDFTALDYWCRKLTAYPIPESAYEKFYGTLTKYTIAKDYVIQPSQYHVCMWYYQDRMQELAKKFPNIFVKTTSKDKHNDDKYGWEAIADEFAPSPADTERNRKSPALDVLMRFDRKIQAAKDLEETHKANRR